MQNQNINPQRQSIRLQEYDYAQPGAYFVTVISHQRKNRFGKIANGEMNLNQVGKIVEQTWLEIPLHFPNANIDIFVIMPNHIHGIINIIEDGRVGARHASPLQKPQNGVQPQSIGAIIGSFKSAVTKRVHDLGLLIGEKIWQRNYYEHIIRNEDDYHQITDYIETNPINWEYDHDNPDNF
jgi:REP element-mobilizing transposase RayT